MSPTPALAARWLADDWERLPGQRPVPFGTFVDGTRLASSRHGSGPGAHRGNQRKDREGTALGHGDINDHGIPPGGSAPALALGRDGVTGVTGGGRAAGAPRWPVPARPAAWSRALQHFIPVYLIRFAYMAGHAGRSPPS